MSVHFHPSNYFLLSTFHAHTRHVHTCKTSTGCRGGCEIMFYLDYKSLYWLEWQKKYNNTCFVLQTQYNNTCFVLQKQYILNWFCLTKKIALLSLTITIYIKIENQQNNNTNRIHCVQPRFRVQGSGFRVVVLLERLSWAGATLLPVCSCLGTNVMLHYNDMGVFEGVQLFM
jgi:hypothetical protein